MYNSSVRFNFFAGAAIFLGLALFFTPFMEYADFFNTASFSGMKLMINPNDDNLKSNIWLILAFISGFIAFFILIGDDLEIGAIITSLFSVIFMIVFRVSFASTYVEQDNSYSIKALEELLFTKWGYICSLICMIIGALLSIVN